MSQFNPLALFAVIFILPLSAHGQATHDTTVTWRSYSHTGTAEVQVFPTPPDHEDETHTVVIREVARNRGPTTVDDLPYLADLLGRRLGVDPTATYWVIHWGNHSFEGADGNGDKALFLRATFNRTSSGNLSSPYWNVISETDVRKLTDRRWRK